MNSFNYLKKMSLFRSSTIIFPIISKEEFPEKSRFLENLIKKGSFTYKEIGSTKEKQRNSLSELLTEVVFIKTISFIRSGS